MEKKIVPTLINFKKFEIGAILVNHFGNQRKTRIASILIGFLLLAACNLVAAETEKKENIFKEVASIQGRGAMNFLTVPGELASSFRTEKKEHPKAWPLTYVPRFFSNTAIRVGSSVNDMLVLPFVAPWGGETKPITRHFDLPNYVWEKE